MRDATPNPLPSRQPPSASDAPPPPSAPPLPGDPPADTAIAPDTDPRNRSPLIAWPMGILLVLAVAGARAIWLAFFSPLELAADEAQYWDWSRRLDLSYATKGPGIAWLIAASTHCLGDSEFAVRLPAVITHALAALAVGLAAGAALPTRADRSRAACYAVVAFLLIPAFHLTGMLMTIDMPYIACWGIAAWLGWVCIDRARAGRSFYIAGTALGLALGIGFLFKYTIVLLAIAMIAYLLLARRRDDRSTRRWTYPARRSLAVVVVVALASTLPVIIWNATHAWPTVRHLLGHAALPGSDIPADTPPTPTTSSTLPDAPPTALHALEDFITTLITRYDPTWTLDFIGAQIGIVGPILIAFALAIGASRPRRRDRLASPTPAPEREADRYLIWCALPIWIFYLLLTGLAEPEGNWPIAAYVTLAALAGRVAAREFPRLAARRRAWDAHFDPKPRQGILRRQPESWFQIAWHWAIGYALAAVIASYMLIPVSRAPIVGPVVPIHRLTGHADFADQVELRRSALRDRTGTDPIIAASRYQTAALLAFYLPGRPAVRSAASILGDRKSSYDFFPDTRWDDLPVDELARPAVLVGSSRERWESALRLTDIESLTITQPRAHRDDREVSVHLATSFAGVRPQRSTLNAEHASPANHTKPEAPP